MAKSSQPLPALFVGLIIEFVFGVLLGPHFYPLDPAQGGRMSRSTWLVIFESKKGTITMKAVIILVVLHVLCCSVACADDAELKVAGGATVGKPADGFAWKKVKETEEKPVPNAQWFEATKDGSLARVILTVIQYSADTDTKKRTQIKAFFNGTFDGLKAQGFSNFKGEKPSLTPPFSDHSSFVLVANNKQGTPVYFHMNLYFGTHTYQVQAMSLTDAEAKSLVKVADTIKE